MTRRALVVLLLTLLCAGCVHRAKWLQGKWIFDRERTEQALAQPPDSTGKDRTIVEGLKELATSLLAPPLLATFEGSQIEFTNKEMIVTDKAGNGSASTYDVLATPDADTIRLKHGDGDVVTCHRDGSHFWRMAPGSSEVRVYFRRIE